MPASERSPAAAAAPPVPPPDDSAASPYGPLRLTLVVLVPFGAGYFMSFLFRNINAVVGHHLIRDLGLSGADIGLLTATYFLTFALAQIPVGIALDRFGPRKVSAALMCIAGAGAVLFAYGHTRDALVVARGLIGLGVASCLMASFQAVTLWYPKPRWAFYNSLIMAVGGLGAVAGTAPVEAALRLTDWRGLFIWLGVATVAVAAFTFLVVPERKRDAKPERLLHVIAGVGRVLVHPVLRAMAPLLVFAQAANLAILGLWSGLWLRDVAGFGADDIALYAGLMNLGMTAGFILNALLSEAGRRWRIGNEAIMVSLLGLFFLAQLAIVLRLDVRAAWPWIAFGMFSNASIFCYPILAGRVPMAFSGRANASANFLSFCGAFLGQYAMGWVMDLFPRQPGGGYAGTAYDYAFGSVLALEIAALLWFLYAHRRSGAPAD
ncbi:MAG: MFS transporter [Rhodospirillaceae bacterium]|nr:MFS transporter [Rhodospirillaceae bacterium]